VADITWSHADASADLARKPLWRILGTRGAIVDTGAGAGNGLLTEIEGPVSGAIRTVTIDGETRQTADVPYKTSDWAAFYQDVADHLLRGKPVPVSGEAGRRTIAVFEAAERSSRTGQTEPVAFD
jgi:predicted dehydrogenase